ncbi:site-specific recombinase, phage integrase family [Treponema primitia ZAS-2]|uniref:Site-specific recombinase, phage integrase family n=1 Tax=Treponema primitia (strain ATCC BAA-887 / DSM 12427 / ZAS-2) TaxID=545694 RepID=F5YGJ5_TREPZ|nr:site-specific recombinase, phage integrase family [Treponema primitia]AEF85745.1 site-specific recombinase, phage integrase family [Treponema primitia ZAS-2]
MSGKELFRLYINDYTKTPIYYAHLYDDDGRQTDARMSCRTTDKEKAKLYATENRKTFLENYYKKKDKESFYNLLTNYYTENSPLLIKAMKKRDIGDQQIRQYKAFIDNYYIPFLKKNNITTLEKANTLEVVERFQEYCQDDKQNDLQHSITGKTLNNNLTSIAKIFNQVLVTNSVFLLDYRVREKPGERKEIGIIPISTTLNVLFDDHLWSKNNEKTTIPFLINKTRHIETFRLLCLIGNLCGLRVAEIYMLRKSYIKKIGDTYFFDIVNSRINQSGTKTPAGKRLVPIHPIVYKHLIKYIKDNDRTDYLFWNGGKGISYSQFDRSSKIFSFLSGYDINTIKKHNIVFNSFRHFFKTMLQNKIPEYKDYIEMIMGHGKNKKGDMSKNYLHLEKIGNELLEKNGQMIIKVIDDYRKDIEKENILNWDYSSIKDILSNKEIIPKKEYVKNEIMYKDVSSTIEKKYLIYCLKNTETVIDILDDDDYFRDDLIQL